VTPVRKITCDVAEKWDFITS